MSEAVCADNSEMDISAIALQGIQQASGQLDQAATAIASMGTTTPANADVDTVTLSAAVVAMTAAKNETAANLETAKVANEMSKSAIDLMA